MPPRAHHRGPSAVPSAGGWTLTEMLMVLAILATLAGLALPAYQQQQRQVRRSDARTALQQLQFEQTRYRGNHDSFAGQLGDLGWSGEHSPQGHYRLQLSEADAWGYVAEATPIGAQALDTPCSPLRLRWRDAATVVLSSGTQTDGDAARCWLR